MSKESAKKVIAMIRENIENDSEVDELIEIFKNQKDVESIILSPDDFEEFCRVCKIDAGEDNG